MSDGATGDLAGTRARAAIITRLYSEVFNVPAVGEDDDFFQLGGDSLIATALLTGIERHFGRVLSMSVLLEAPTPRKLADRILEAIKTDRALRCVVPIKTDGIPPAIFCVHGTNGESMLPLRLSTALGNRSVYGFRAIGLEEGEHPLTSIEAMAKDYLDGIAAVAPKGPILLLGHCDGSFVAYEMARQLEAAGHPAAGLILVDPSADQTRVPQLHHSGLELLLRRSRLRNKAEELRVQVVVASDASGTDRRLLVHDGIRAAAMLYELRPYGGPVLLFNTPERRLRLLDRERGFPAFVSRLEVVDLSVHHLEMFSKELRKICVEIGAFIQRLGLG